MKTHKIIVNSFVFILLLATSSLTVTTAQVLKPYELLKAPPLLHLKHSSTNLRVLSDNSDAQKNEVPWFLTTNLPGGLAAADVVRDELFPLKSGAEYHPMGLYTGTRFLVPKATVSFDNNVKVAVHRSHYTNPLYYNPNWRYTPEMMCGGVPLCSTWIPIPATRANFCDNDYCAQHQLNTFDITQAYKYNLTTWHLQVPAGNTRIANSTPEPGGSYTNLVGTVVNFGPRDHTAYLNDQNTKWKHRNAGGTLNDTFYFGTYFNYIGPQTSLLQRIPTQTLTIANFERVEIRPSVNRYPALPRNRSIHRTDCAAPTYCTYAEEIQNFTNWLIRYRNIIGFKSSYIGSATSGLSNKTIISNGTVTNSRLRWALQQTGNYFATDASAANSSCRKNDLLLVSAGDYATETDSTVGYTNTSASWRGAAIAGGTVSRESVSTAGVSTQTTSSYTPYTTTFVNNAGSPGGTLADITHALYWTDLLPSRTDARRIGNTVAWADANPGSGNQIGSFAQHLGDPVTSQNLKTNIVNFGVPGNIPVSKRIWASDFGNPSTNDPATLGWYYGQSGVPAGKPTTMTGFTDDLIRAAYNGHGSYYPLQSRDLPNRIEPHRAVRHMLLKSTANHWTKANDTGEHAVLEEYLPTGIPMMGVYQTKGNTLEEGNVVAYNGNDPSITASVMANMGLSSSTPAWLGFDAQVGLTYQVANQANSNARTVVSPIFTSYTAPITSMVRLRQSNSGATTNYSNITAFMQSLLINDVSGGTYDYKDLLDYVQGSSAKEGSDINDLDDMLNRPFRARRKPSGTGVPTSGVLGPVFNSTPVIVRHQDYGYGFVASDLTATSYKTFVNTKKSAAPRLAFGANDGMFHVFNGYAATVSDNTVSNVNNKGMEELAYIPAGIYDKLKYTADPLSAHHILGDQTNDSSIGFRYTVDGPASTGDVFFNNAWRSIVTGSLGAGGKGLFAIDVTTGTSLSASSVLWDKTHQGSWDAADWDDVGHMQNQPGIFKLTTGQFAVITGNGSNSNNRRSALFFINPQTGAVIKKIAFANTFTTGLPVDGGNGLMGLAFVFNSNREVVTIYGGNLFGQLYKFDVSNDNPNNWTSSKLFTTPSQPITHKPLVYPHPLGGNMVIFGTGSNLLYEDPTYTIEQALYGVRDFGTIPPPGTINTPGGGTTIPGGFLRANLTEQTISTTTGATNNLTFRTLSNNAIDYNTKRGWYIRLPLRATFSKALPNQSIPNLETTEQITGNMKIVGNRLVFSSATAIYSQTPEDKCTFDDVVKAAVTSVNPLTGGLLDAVLLDTNGDGVINSSDNAAAMGYVQASSGAVGNVTNASGTTIASSAANANGAGVTPYIIRTGSNYGTAYDGIIRSNVQSTPVRSWRQLIPR